MFSFFSHSGWLIYKAAGSLCGAVDVFDASLRKERYKGKYEFNFVSPSQVVVKRISSGVRILMESNFSFEITKIDVFKDRFVVARSTDTLLLADFETLDVSEIPWVGSGNETFHFDHPGVSVVFNAGELTLVEFRPQFMSS